MGKHIGIKHNKAFSDPELGEITLVDHSGDIHGLLTSETTKVLHIFLKTPLNTSWKSHLKISSSENNPI